MIGKFIEKAEATLQNQNAVIKNLEIQVGQLAIALTGRTLGNLPSNTEINPKEQAKAITTQSGVQLPKIHIKRPAVIGEATSPVEEETFEQDEQPKESTLEKSSEKLWDKAKVTISPYEPPISFPQRSKKHKTEQQYKKFLEIFKRLHINIPLADVLFQMPNYEKFLQDILSNKRKLEDHETAMLTKEFCFEKALYDTGASINLMLLSVFRKLGLGEAKAPTVTLQLADTSQRNN
ncbi:uncharacterized protein LOC111384950 [Olea europaea var. sylvestris]|uniref:uncharacterized protein LOC111384950 n=1 Tax=Olea europaea var. sylvestris TaxID=158386 RepID=UPI000C1D0FF5|nr:uncharacterized protein LOC111384950 [Olea europaea var. sylvestris]